MTTQQKQKISWELNNYVSAFPSQRQAANSLKGCSEATIIGILKNNWDTISDEMWRNIENQLDRRRTKAQLVETQNFMTLILYFTMAQQEGASFAITGNAGYGKSFAGKAFASANRDKNTYYIECAEYWNKKMFLCNILQTMGKQYGGMNVGELMQAIVSELRRQHKPLIILDEVDKLSDPVLKFFITLYNELNGACGFVWTSTDNITKRLMRGVNLNKNGYQELYSRIGQRFITLPMASSADMKQVCQANGITDEEEVNRVINESQGDLRRIERNILKKKAIDMRKTLKSVA